MARSNSEFVADYQREFPHRVKRSAREWLELAFICERRAIYSDSASDRMHLLKMAVACLERARKMAFEENAAADTVH
jgi:hypothetical protein